MFYVKLFEYFLQEYQKQICTLVQDYLGKLNGYKAKMQERENLQLDYDKWRNVVKSYQEKPPKETEKIENAEKKYENYKELFEATNLNLTQELSDLIESRYEHFDSSYSLVISSSNERDPT